MTKKRGLDFKDVILVLAVGSQIGLSIALPVLIGLAVGYWIDRRLGSLPWITLVLTLIGAVVGPVMAYRWAITTVCRQFERKEEENES